MLAPALFLVAIDWILQHLAPHVGIDVGQYHFTDLTYADDTAIFMPDTSQATDILQTFNSMAAPLGLKLSWTKTKLQNIGAGDPPSTFSFDGIPVEAWRNLHILVANSVRRVTAAQTCYGELD